jgi:hypothetical protein
MFEGGSDGDWRVWDSLLCTETSDSLVSLDISYGTSCADLDRF